MAISCNVEEHQAIFASYFMKHITQTLEFPKGLERLYQKAIVYEWISFVYMISAAFFSFMVMSNSQTMKTVWLEDTLGIVPPLSFLIASKIVRKAANKNFPYGFHRITNMAFFTSSLALLALGLFLFIDGTTVLIKQEHPHIPNIQIFGHSIWLGFIMIIALAWSSLPSTVLGHIKIPLAHQLADKILYADSKMNKASWTSGFASIFGIIGIGLGYWWADALVGALISLNIMYDGFKNVKKAILDLLDEVPKHLDGEQVDPLIHQVKKLALSQDWIQSADLRFRDEGHVFFGDIFVLSKENPLDIHKIQQLQAEIKNLHWRLQDIIIMPLYEKAKPSKRGA